MMSCTNLLTEALRLTNSMGQSSESEIDTNLNPSFDFLGDESTACDEMMRDFEKDGIPQVFMVDLVGDYLDEMVANSDRCKVCAVHISHNCVDLCTLPPLLLVSGHIKEST